MAILTKDELLTKIKESDGSEDSRIALLEDISDTYDNFADPEDWKSKYEENDAAWKKKYTDRFFSASAEEPEDLAPPEPKRLKFEDLFKTE